MCLRALKLGLVTVLWLGVGLGCSQQKQPEGTPVDQAWEATAPTQAPTGAADVSATRPAVSGPGGEAAVPAGEAAGGGEQVDPVVAVVNGKPIGRAQLVAMLIETHGLTLLEQMILLAAVEQRAAELGLKVTPADIAAAHEDSLRRISMPIGGEGAPLDRPAAERLLSEFLAAKNLSPGEWDLRMRQRAYVRKIAEAEATKVVVTSAMLSEEYKRAFGERAQIRHIQVSSLAAVARVKAALEQGGDFAAVARELSENQITGAGGGLMPAFTRNEADVPPLIRETAFGMKPGEVSPAVQADNWYHIIKLERLFPPSGVSFDNTDREALKKRLMEQLTRQRQEALEVDLFRSAHVDIRDEALAKRFRAKHPK